MIIQYKQWFIAILLGLLAAPAAAAEIAGVKLADSAALEAGAPELVLNGAGLRTRLFFKVYVGALYLGRRTNSGPAVLGDPGPKRIALHMLRELSAEQFFTALEDGLKNNHAPDELARLDTRIRLLRALFDALKVAKPGDEILIDWLPGKGTRFTVNGTVRDTITGEDFNRALLRIWVGENPADADLRKAMLGG